MKMLRDILASVSGGTAVAPLLTRIAVDGIAHPQPLDSRLAPAGSKPRLGVPGWWHGLGGSLSLWAVACGAAVIALHHATSDVGFRDGAYLTGVVTLILFTVAATVAMHRRLIRPAPHGPAHGTSNYKQHSLTPYNVSHWSKISWSIKPKTWQRIHVTLAIGATLPFWWHCDPGRESIIDLVLKTVAILLLASGFLGVTVTDLTRWRLLSPKFSPALSARLIKGLLTVHRGLALLTFMLITIHVLAVLYFAGV